MALKLPKLLRSVVIVDKQSRPALAFQQWWQSVAKQIETQEATQDQMLEDIATALEQAGIALDRANSLMPDLPPVTVQADYTGAILAGQLPRLVQARRYDDTTEVTVTSTWSAVLLTGDATFSIGAATGILEITALTSSATISVVSVYNSIERSRIVAVTKTVSDPPDSGSEATSDSSIDPTSAASYGAANAGPLTLTCGASGEVDLSASLSFWIDESGAGEKHCFGKWQVSPASAGTWSDVDTEIQSDTPATNAGFGGTEAGAIAVNQTATGLTPTSAYDFQLLLRNDSGTVPLYFVGTATATTS